MNATIRMLMRAMSPITQGEGTKGNEQIIRREPVQTPLGVRYVPTITGNSLRHRMLREPLAEQLVSAWALQKTLTKEQVRFLFNGGALGGEHGSSLGRIEEIQRLLPMTALLGASLPDAIMPGRLRMGIAWLVCAETLPAIERDTPADWWPIIAPDHKGQPVRQFVATNAESFVGRGQYYRHDAARHRPDLLEKDSSADYAGMPHGGELVMAGAEFYLRIDVARCDDLTLGALLFGLSAWHESGATVGGQSSRGHGRLAPSIELGGLDADTLIATYLQHVANVREEGTRLLRSLWAKAVAA